MGSFGMKQEHVVTHLNKKWSHCLDLQQQSLFNIVLDKQQFTFEGNLLYTLFKQSI